jgi:hypothetical protein
MKIEWYEIGYREKRERKVYNILQNMLDNFILIFITRSCRMAWKHSHCDLCVLIRGNSDWMKGRTGKMFMIIHYVKGMAA